RCQAIPDSRAAVPPARFERRAEFAERCRFPASSFVVPMRRQWGRLKQGGRRCGLWCSRKPVRTAKWTGPPTPEQLEAFAAMDRFTEELVKAGVFIAAAGLKNSAQAKRIVLEGPRRTVIDGPFAESRELVAGFSIWEVK